MSGSLVLKAPEKMSREYFFDLVYAYVPLFIPEIMVKVLNF